MLIEHLLCTMHHSDHWENSNKQNRQKILAIVLSSSPLLIIADSMCSLTHLLIQQIYTEHCATSREYTTEQNKLNLYSHRASVTLKETNFKLIIYK